MTPPNDTDREPAATGGFGAREWLPWMLAAVVAAVFCVLYPHLLTDGDSCVYAALGRSMARGTWQDWVAPQWSFHGAKACFHEHPPGAFWGTALVDLLGVDAARAALVANALWALVAASGVVALTRRLTMRTEGVGVHVAQIAGGVFLLHLTPLRYVQRAGIDFPFAACSVWAITAALRLRESPRWALLLAAGLAGAFMTRGAFAGAPAVVVGYLLFEPSLRPPLRPPLGRTVVGVLGAVSLLAAFDRLHAAATGHGFWLAYIERQVLPSFGAGGSRHAKADFSAGYYLSRTVLYSLPWSILPVARAVQAARGRRPLGLPAAWRLAAVWFAFAVLGPALTSRPSSRYLFEAWVPAAVLFALSLPAGWGTRRAQAIAWCVPLLVPALAIGKSFLHVNDDEWRTAELLDAFRAARVVPARPVRGPFFPEDDGRKSLLWFHLDTDVYADLPAAPRDADLWVLAGTPPPPAAELVLTTPLGSLFRPRR